MLVSRAWGFEPKQLITWIKTKIDAPNEPEIDDLQFGMGHYTRGVTEHLILATRGKTGDLVKSRSIRNVIFAQRRKHSYKPEATYDLIEQLFDGPYLELFARYARDGWTSYGDEIKQ